MNAALKIAGEGLGLNWKWEGFIVAIKSGTCMSTSSFCAGKNSEISLALLSFSMPRHIVPFTGSRVDSQGKKSMFLVWGAQAVYLGQKGRVPGNNLGLPPFLTI